MDELRAGFNEKIEDMKNKEKEAMDVWRNREEELDRATEELRFEVLKAKESHEMLRNSLDSGDNEYLK